MPPQGIRAPGQEVGSGWFLKRGEEEEPRAGALALTRRPCRRPALEGAGCQLPRSRCSLEVACCSVEGPAPSSSVPQHLLGSCMPGHLGAGALSQPTVGGRLGAGLGNEKRSWPVG